MNTFSQKPADVTRTWYEIDAQGVPLGRLATKAANLLIGKHKTTYTAHVDGGDFVVITNADKVVLTGRKGQEAFYRHTGYPGGIKSQLKATALENNPIKVLENAVRGMLPKNKLLTQRLKRLKVIAGMEHPHQAQKPQKVNI